MIPTNKTVYQNKKLKKCLYIYTPYLRDIIIYNQRQNIMGILKSVFKIPPSPPIQWCEPITYLDASFSHRFSTLLRRG